MNFDFEPVYRDKDVLLNDEYIRQVVHNEAFSIVNMDDDELKESIIEDILVFTMWELQTSDKLSFTFNDLVKFLPVELHDRVREALGTPDVSIYIDHKLGDEIRIIKDLDVLQQAMDFCGVWYSGFVIPEGIKVVMTSKDAVKPSPEELSMDMLANAPWSKTLN